MRELLRYLRLHIRKLEPLVQKYKDLPRAPGEQAVWLSLTTLPSRISRVGPTLKSLLDQTVRADGIRLNLPDQSRRESCSYVIPPFLEGLPPIHLVSCAKDWGPITKMLPTVQDFQDQPDTRIIVVDDDTIYPRTLVEALTRTSEERPGSAICMRGWKLPRDFCHSDRKYVQASEIGSPSPVEIMQGASGFLVKPRFFEGGVLKDEAAPEEAFFVDDIFVSGTLAKVGVPRFVAPSPLRFVRISSLAAMGTPSLVHGENRDGHNNATLYRYFNDFWKLRD